MALTAITAGAALASATYGIASGEDQSRRQKILQGRAGAAQQKAEAAAAAESQRAANEADKARRRAANLGDLMTDQQVLALQGPSSTLLSGGSGRIGSRLNTPTMLGG